jgi:hypothetical protein
MAVFENFSDLLRRFRQHHDHRELAIGGQAIAFIGAEFLFFGDYTLAGDNPAQRSDDFATPGDDISIWVGHPHEKAPVSADSV